MKNALCTWQIDATLGEGPTWVPGEQAIYWVDIEQRNVHRLGAAGKKTSWHIDQQITSLAPRAGGGFIATTRHGFAFLELESGPDLETSSVEMICEPEANQPGNRFNDGKVDGHGRFWAGSMDESEEAPSGALYRLDADLTLTEIESGYCISNGPAFSPDGATLYHAESTRGEVYAYALEDDGTVADKRVFVTLGDGEGVPDGMTTDREGNLWLCHFGGACVSCLSPAGRRLERIELPVPNVTSCCFGGPNLDTLFITTARFLMSDEALGRHPLAGSLFTIRPGATGLEPTLFAG